MDTDEYSWIYLFFIALHGILTLFAPALLYCGYIVWVDSRDWCDQIHEGCFTDIRTIIALPQYQWGVPEGYELNWLVTDHPHDDVIKWKYFPRYWSFVRGIHRSPVNSPHKGQWRGALMLSLICVAINGCVNSREAGNMRRYRAHYDVTVMQSRCRRRKRLNRKLSFFLQSIQVRYPPLRVWWEYWLTNIPSEFHVSEPLLSCMGR